MIIKYINSINKKINLQEIDIKNFSSLSQIYSFTTENISGYFEHLDFTDKNVLTVCASGDHIINSFYSGAKVVVGFDINYLSLIYAELKMVALEQLEYEEFLQFFMINDIDNKSKNENAFDYNTYIKLKKHLSKDALMYWDMIYKEFHNNGYEIRNSYLFNNKYDNNELKINSNLYLRNKCTYDNAKKQISGKELILLNANYRDIDPFSLPNITNCDIILMSNISDYIKELYDISSNYLEEYMKEIIQKFKIKDNKIVCAYLYNIKNLKYRSEIDNPTIRKYVFDKLKVKYIEKSFKSVIKDCEDSVIII